MTVFRRYLLAIIALLASPLALATYTCSGTITTLSLNTAGTVNLSTSFGLTNVYLCQVGATFNSVTPDTCKGILAVLLAAQAESKSISMTFSDALTCATHPSWANLAGWYYGPQM